MDITDAFAGFGIKCDVFVKHSFKDKNKDDEFKKEFTDRLNSGEYEFVYSTNYFPLVAECCEEQGFKYISWSYDAPLNVPDIERTLGLSCNYVFLYDRGQCEKFRAKGFDNVYHLPLAVNTKRLDKISLSAEDRLKYGAQISFVGNLYRSALLNIRSIIEQYQTGYLDALMAVQSKIYGCYFIEEIISDTFIEGINKSICDSTMKLRAESSAEKNDKEDDPVFSVSREALSYAMAAQITREERILILKLLSNHFDVKLYSRDNCEMLNKVKHMGEVTYDTEMTKVFRASDINLNISLKCIGTGMPLRTLDIMGAGGFLLSNYQPELAENFINGEDIVMYDSIEDMYEKVDYYLKRDDLRKKIAISGHDKISQKFRYEDRIEFMMNAARIL